MLIYIATHDGKLNSVGWKSLIDARNFVLWQVSGRTLTDDIPMKISYLDEQGREHDWLIYEVEVKDEG